ncbi:hypothetical protein [Lysobacter sp. GCM10012299]|uniref:hypothetical protein n=1 Tax=Lysobacter sp. GCM10012299 TaxID=3317333 RepID=UPI0036121EBC
MSLTYFFRGALCALAMTFFFSTPSFAQVVSSKGMATVAYTGRLSADERQAAMTRANLSALETYVAETNLAKVKVLEARRDEFESKLDRLILGSTVLSETPDKKSKTYTIVVRADINAALLRAELDGGSATAMASQAQRSLVTLLFMARMQDSVRSFQAREYRRLDASQTSTIAGSYVERTKEGESIGGSSIGTTGSRQVDGTGKESTSLVVENGGSTTQKADKVAWTVTNAAEINTAMTGIFSNAGYEVVEAEFAEGESGGQLSVARVRKDFSTGNDLSADVLRSTAAGVRNARIPLLAVGTLDVGIRDTDPVTGLVRVNVTVTGKVMDVTGRFPKTVSSVGPVQFAGLGNTETVARNNALTLASEKAAQTMVDELNVRAVR